MNKYQDTRSFTSLQQLFEYLDIEVSIDDSKFEKYTLKVEPYEPEKIEKTYSIPEVGAMLQYHPAAIYPHIKEGLLVVCQYRPYRVTEKEIQLYKERLEKRWKK